MTFSKQAYILLRSCAENLTNVDFGTLLNRSVEHAMLDPNYDDTVRWIAVTRALEDMKRSDLIQKPAI